MSDALVLALISHFIAWTFTGAPRDTLAWVRVTLCATVARGQARAGEVRWFQQLSNDFSQRKVACERLEAPCFAQPRLAFEAGWSGCGRTGRSSASCARVLPLDSLPDAGDTDGGEQEFGPLRWFPAAISFFDAERI